MPLTGPRSLTVRGLGAARIYKEGWEFDSPLVAGYYGLGAKKSQP